MRARTRGPGAVAVALLAMVGLFAVGVGGVGSANEPTIPTADIAAPAGDTSGGLTTAAMTAEAEVITIGTGGSRYSEWIDDDLVTHVDLAVEDVLKGDVDASVDVVLPGGIDAKRKIPVAVTYPGAPQIAPQEDVVLFLDANQLGYTVVGFAQGKFSIGENAEGVRVVDTANGEVSLAEFKEQIAAQVEAGS